MKKLAQNILHTIDSYGLIFCAVLLALLIPLYPKIPLFSPIEQYIVRVRLEDFIVLVSVAFTFIQIIRKKARFDKIVLLLMSSYALAGLLSMIAAVFVTQSIPLQPLHIAKTALHFFRYMEYFSVFFVGYAALKSRKDVHALFKFLVLTIIAVALYGYMQKFFYWPVYSTMNREFSKGIRLVLTEHARIQSTFAGHYDMAAYLVVVLPFVLSLALATKRKQIKVILFSTYALGFWLMVMSASRIPFAASILGSLLVLLFWSYFQTNVRKKITFALSRVSLWSFFLVIMLYYFGQTMLDRISNAISTADNPIDINKMIDSVLDPLPIPQSSQLLAWLPKLPAIPENSEPAPDLEAAIIAQVATIGDQPPVPRQQPTAVVAPDRPRDVYEDIPEPIETTETLADGTVERKVIHKTRVYSDCALQHELSLCIRLESLWPWAIQSFLTNPITGTGYATLNKQFVDEFTIADSTDNNYLRTLGETGALGFITFYGTIVYLLISTTRTLLLKQTHPFDRALSVGYISGTLGLLVNATYIDVFAASKVAYTFWFFSGVIRASQSFTPIRTINDEKTIKQKKHKRIKTKKQ